MAGRRSKQVRSRARVAVFKVTATGSDAFRRSLGFCTGLSATLVCLALVPDAGGQYRLDSWTTDNGLPQNSVTGLTQTPDQYIGFTTNDGLVRFDGVRFKVFNKSNTPSGNDYRFTGLRGTIAISGGKSLRRIVCIEQRPRRS